MSDHQAFFAELDAKGEEAVRVDLAKGVYASGNSSQLVHEWLSSKERARESASSAKRDAREEETLSIAREANSIAREALHNSRCANHIAIAAAIFAALATIIAAVIGVMYGHP